MRSALALPGSGVTVTVVVGLILVEREIIRVVIGRRSAARYLSVVTSPLLVIFGLVLIARTLDLLR